MISMGNQTVTPEKVAQTPYQMVFEWNKIAGNPVSTTPTEDVFNNDAVRRKCYSLIAEEMSELSDAIDEDDRTEMLDALCDLEVVIYGAACHFGLQLNLPTIDETNISVLTTMLRISVGVLGQDTEQFKTVATRLANQLALVRAISAGLGFDHSAAFLLVHESNMSKFCPTEELAKQTVAEYEKGDRYDTPAYRKEGDLWVVYNKSTGKILKSIKYHPVKLAELALVSSDDQTQS